MNASISESDAATCIISFWKGFKVRRIFSKMESIETWDALDEQRSIFDEEISKSPEYAMAWEIALKKTDDRLCSEEHKYSFQHWWTYQQDNNDGYGDNSGDWMWNEGGYNDW